MCLSFIREMNTVEDPMCHRNRTNKFIVYKLIYESFNKSYEGSTAVQWLVLLPNSKKVETCLEQGLSAEFPCSPRVCEGSLRVLQHPPPIQRRVGFVGYSQVSMGESMHLNGCLSRVYSAARIDSNTP